jgi:hypothetical protein
MNPTRRELLQGGALAAAGALVVSPRILLAQTPPPAAPDRGPALDKEMVREFVVAAHANLARTKEMLEPQPALVNATWDWGGGDWETGLGGASHMGSKEIAEYLLGKGARMDVFCAAMLGRIEIVKAFLAADPQVVHLRGPHGIPLVRHAVAGGQQAVVDLLVAHGAKV